MAGLDLGDVVLERAGLCSFRVLDEEGRPIAGAQAEPLGFGRFATSRRSDAEGQGELPCVPARGASFRFGALRYADQVLQLRGGDTPEIVLEPTTSLDIQLLGRAGERSGITLHVTSTGAPFVGESLERAQTLFSGTDCTLLEQSADSVTLACTPDESGRVQLVGLRPGSRLQIEVLDLPGHTLATRRVTLAAREWKGLEIQLDP